MKAAKLLMPVLVTTILLAMSNVGAAPPIKVDGATHFFVLTSKEPDKRNGRLIIFLRLEGNEISSIGYGSYGMSRSAARKGRSPQIGREIATAIKQLGRTDLAPGSGASKKEVTLIGLGSFIVKPLFTYTGESSRTTAHQAIQLAIRKMTKLLLGEMTAKLKKNKKPSLVGFGSFSVSKRAARTGRNPQTGKEIKISGKRRATKSGKTVIDFEISEKAWHTRNLSIPL